MGCAESIPVSDSDLNVPFPVNPNIPCLGRQSPPSTSRVKILVPPKVFSSRGGPFEIKCSDNDRSFHGIKIINKTTVQRNQMDLYDGDNQHIAVCFKISSLHKQGADIYTLSPLHDGQKTACSSHDYNGKSLYKYAEVSRPSRVKPYEVTFHNEMSKWTAPTFTAHEEMDYTGLSRLVVKARSSGTVVATAKNGRWGNTSRVGAFLVTMCPGMDPCLLILVTAICDQVAWDNRPKPNHMG